MFAHCSPLESFVLRAPLFPYAFADPHQIKDTQGARMNASLEMKALRRQSNREVQRPGVSRGAVASDSRYMKRVGYRKAGPRHAKLPIVYLNDEELDEYHEATGGSVNWRYRCTSCDGEVCDVGSTTTNRRNHLKVCSAFMDKVRKAQATESEKETSSDCTSSRAAVTPNTNLHSFFCPRSVEKLGKRDMIPHWVDMAQAVMVKGLPFGIFADEEITRVLRAANPKWMLPSAKIIVKTIVLMSEFAFASMFKTLKRNAARLGTSQLMCIQFDEWTDKGGRPYLGMNYTTIDEDWNFISAVLGIKHLKQRARAEGLVDEARKVFGEPQ